MGCFHCKFAVKHCFWAKYQGPMCEGEGHPKVMVTICIAFNVKVKGQRAGIASLSFSQKLQVLSFACVYLNTAKVNVFPL